jgi:hypothetical protein
VRGHVTAGDGRAVNVDAPVIIDGSVLCFLGRDRTALPSGKAARRPWRNSQAPWRNSMDTPRVSAALANAKVAW